MERKNRMRRGLDGEEYEFNAIRTVCRLSM